MKKMKIGGISFLIASAIFGLISCEEDSVNLSCGPYLEKEYLSNKDSSSAVILGEKTIKLSSCYSQDKYTYKIESGGNYVFTYYYINRYYNEQLIPDDARLEERLLFEIPSITTDFYIDDFCKHKVFYTADVAFVKGTELYNGDGCISGSRFEINEPEGLKVGYDVNINIPVYNYSEDTTFSIQFSKKFYLAKGADD